MRSFVKANSVFKDWAEDSDDVNAQIIEHDSKWWKLDRFVKDANEIPRIVDVMKEHALQLKNCYI